MIPEGAVKAGDIIYLGAPTGHVRDWVIPHRIVKVSRIKLHVVDLTQTTGFVYRFDREHSSFYTSRQEALQSNIQILEDWITYYKSYIKAQKAVLKELNDGV